MVFSSAIFLLFFFPLFLMLYFGISALTRKWPIVKRYGLNSIVLIFSLLFYYWGEDVIVVVMIISTTIDYTAGLLVSGQMFRKGKVEPLEPGTHRSLTQKLGLVISIIMNLTILGVFKYFNFFVDSFNTAFVTVGLDSLVMHNVVQIALPLGISFYTFQTMSYTIDVYRGDVAATRNFLDFATFVTMFPQLVAGPIIRYRDIAGSLILRHVNSEQFASGVRRFVIGLAKKVLVADIIARAVDDIYGIPYSAMTTEMAWIAAIGFSMQIYYDFSAYSDMAIGLGRMIGFEFKENFNYPLISQSMRELWERWNISVSKWFRDYLFIPLGGSRVSVTRVYANLVTVFFLCGLWHGASWIYVTWGLLHGIFLVIERVGFGKVLMNTWRPLRHLYFIAVYIFTCFWFRSESFEQALVFIGSMAGFAPGDGIAYHAGLFLTPPIVIAFIASFIGAMPVIPWLRDKTDAIMVVPGSSVLINTGLRSLRVISLLILLVVSVAVISGGSYSPFIYFRF